MKKTFYFSIAYIGIQSSMYSLEANFSSPLLFKVPTYSRDNNIVYGRIRFIYEFYINTLITINDLKCMKT